MLDPDIIESLSSYSVQLLEIMTLDALSSSMNILEQRARNPLFVINRPRALMKSLSGMDGREQRDKTLKYLYNQLDASIKKQWPGLVISMICEALKMFSAKGAEKHPAISRGRGPHADGKTGKNNERSLRPLERESQLKTHCEVRACQGIILIAMFISYTQTHPSVNWKGLDWTKLKLAYFEQQTKIGEGSFVQSKWLCLLGILIQIIGDDQCACLKWRLRIAAHTAELFYCLDSSLLAFFTIIEYWSIPVISVAKRPNTIQSFNPFPGRLFLIQRALRPVSTQFISPCRIPHHLITVITSQLPHLSTPTPLNSCTLL